MRRRMTALALATAALLTVGAGVAGTAPAAAGVTADDLVVPVGDQGSTDTPAAETESDREVALARGSRQAADLMGFLPSLYQGKWFVPSSEDARRCIVLRESHANYRASNGTYHGAYQMSSALAVGATWMMQKEVRKEMGDEGVQILQALRRITPDKWNRYWQDRAFWTIWRDGQGAGHWAGGAHSC
jgi:hypothetical protein